MLKGFWYFFKWGYFKALGLNILYIDVEGAGAMYNVLGYVGLAVIFLFSNYCIYNFWNQKDKLLVFLTLLFEVIIFWIIVFILSNTSPCEACEEMIRENLILQYTGLTLCIFLFVICFNLFGIYGVIVKKYYKVQIEKDTENNKKEDNKKKIEKVAKTDNNYIQKKIIIFIAAAIIIIAVEGAALFLLGMHSGNQKRNYKLVIKKIEDENIDEQYSIKIGGSKCIVYPVLHENTDNYIVSCLYKNNGEIKVMFQYQKIISKENIETIYYDDISILNQ